jgi:hypothetical protein
MINQYIKIHEIKLADIYKYENRTGCMFCAYGYHFDPIDNNKFTRMQKYYPKI